MERFRQILLDVWREACRHIHVHESAANIAGLLARHLPLEQLVLHRLDLDHSTLVTLAAVPADHGPPGGDGRTLSKKEFQQLLRWCRGGRVLKRGRRARQELDLLVLRSGDNDLLAAPLLSQGQPHGVVLLAARTGRSFDDSDAELLEALREPLSVALENDRRIHEMAALRDAAEAERGALLRRLGRSQMADTVIGEESGLRQVLERVDLVSKSDVPVLILGETGTGKELIARAIHGRSPRHSGPFIRVNCGAIPAELIDSQLFGHERGSFTGAEQSREGWFERADGGTLFLDEIGELPLEAQVRFLRILQDGFVERVGSHQAIHVDVRIVAATHRDLAAMVGEGQFREDLWYRLAIFPILLPALRERRDDIPALARHFAERAATRFGLSPVQPSDDDVRLLQSYDWPGNIRELGAVIDRAAILGEGHRLDVVKALGAGLGSSTARAREPRAGDPAALDKTAGPPLVSLNEAMRRHIEAALAQSEGRIEGRRGAAAILQINPHTLRAKMRKLGIDWAHVRQTHRRNSP